MSQQLSEATDDAISQPGSTTVESGGLSAEIDVVESGPIGVIIDRLRVRGPSGDISKRAHRLADILRPGGTPLSPIEVDPRLGGAILRSPLDRQHRFFEADVTEDAIELTRQRVEADGSRQPTDFSLTREELGEILDGIESVILPVDAEAE